METDLRQSLAAASLSPRWQVTEECFQTTLEAAYSRFESWRGDDQATVLLLTTDLHADFPLAGEEDAAKRRDLTSHLQLLNRAAHRFKAAAIVNSGDVGLEWPLNDLPRGRQLIDAILQGHQAAAMPLIFALGNHDFFWGEIPAAFWGERLKELNRPFAEQFRFSGDGDYGYWQAPDASVRAYFLNTGAHEVREYTAPQLDFLEDTLSDVPEGTVVAIFQHVCPRPWLGSWGWQGWQSRRLSPMVQLFTDIIERYAASGRPIAGSFYGDAHIDAFEQWNGINHVICQGYGGTDMRPPFARYTWLEKECCFDALAIKPQTRHMRLFRIGAGGPYCDRGASFPPPNEDGDYIELDQRLK